MKRLVALTLFLAVLALTLAPVAHAQQDSARTGTVEGAVVNGTTNTAAAGATVQLRIFNRMDPVGERQATADSQGRFRFESLDSGPDMRYVASVKHEGVDYLAPTAIDPNNPQGPAAITVYDGTESDADVAILSASIAIPEVDSATGLMLALEVITFINKGNRTYVGSLFSDPANGGVLKVHLPPGAMDIGLGEGFGAEEPRQTPEGLLTRSAVPPGQLGLVYTYYLPFDAREYTLERSFPYPADKANFFIASSGPRPSSSQLTDVKTVTISGKPNVALSGQEFKAGQAIMITLSGLPPLVAPGGMSLDTALRWAAAGLAAAGIALAGFYAVRGRRRQGQVEAAAGNAPPQDLEAERRRLVAALAAMDDSFEAGTMGREEYEPARQRLKQQLVDTMLLIREGAGKGAP